MPTPKSTLNIHPKVLASLAVGLAVTAVGAIAAAVTPDVFSALGVWAAPAYALVAAALGALGGWLKTVQAAEEATPPADPPTGASVKVALQPALADGPVGPNTKTNMFSSPGGPVVHTNVAPFPASVQEPSPVPAVQSTVIH